MLYLLKANSGNHLHQCCDRWPYGQQHIWLGGDRRSSFGVAIDLFKADQVDFKLRRFSSATPPYNSSVLNSGSLNKWSACDQHECNVWLHHLPRWLHLLRCIAAAATREACDKALHVSWPLQPQGSDIPITSLQVHYYHNEAVLWLHAVMSQLCMKRCQVAATCAA